MQIIRNSLNTTIGPTDWFTGTVYFDIMAMAVRQVAEELTVRESMIFLDGREFTGKPPGLRTVQPGPLMLVDLTGIRGERVVIIQVNWIG